MNDDNSSGSSNGSESRNWLERIGQAISGGEPRNLQELLDLLKAAHEREVIDADTLSMIEGVLEVAQAQVRDAMIPRGQMEVIPVEASTEEVLKIIVESGHSRFPVVQDDKDEVLGILLAKDLLKLFVNGDRDVDLKSLLREPVFIPESKRLAILLKEFREERNHMAVVVDEFGGVSGLITIEDVLEEIVGEIDDEHDEEEDAFIMRQGDQRFTVHALTPIDTFNDTFDTEFSDDEFDTVGGLLMGELGRLPEGGETVCVGDLEFEVLRADSRRLHLLGIDLDKS